MACVLRVLCVASATVAAIPDIAFAQSTTSLPPIVVQGERPRASGAASARAVTNTVSDRDAAPAGPPPSLTAPTAETARAAIERTPGAVAMVPDTAFKTTPAQTIKDIVDWTPGVFAQPKWGDDTRLSIRGSGLSRNFLNVAYTYSDFRYDNDATFGDNRLPGAPPHYVRAELLHKHPSGVSFGPNFEWAPQSYYVDSANTLTTEPYLLWGVKAAYDGGARYSAYIEGRNLGDKAYIAATSIIDRANAGSRLFNPGTGRAIYAGLRVRL